MRIKRFLALVLACALTAGLLILPSSAARQPSAFPDITDEATAEAAEILRLLDAEKRLGLTVTTEHILIPRKSVTAIIGLADHPLKKGARGCATCRMRETCMFRKGGTHC